MSLSEMVNVDAKPAKLAVQIHRYGIGVIALCQDLEIVRYCSLQLPTPLDLQRYSFVQVGLSKLRTLKSLFIPWLRRASPPMPQLSESGKGCAFLLRRNINCWIRFEFDPRQSRRPRLLHRYVTCDKLDKHSLNVPGLLTAYVALGKIFRKKK